LNGETYGRTTYFVFPSASCPIGALQLQKYIKAMKEPEHLIKKKKKIYRKYMEVSEQAA